MKSKIKKVSGTLLASLACLTVGSISPVHASCENAPMSGSKFKLTGPDSWKLRTTVQKFIDTKNARKLNFELIQTDREAALELGTFFNSIQNGTISAEAGGNLDFIVAEEDVSEKDRLEGFKKAALDITTTQVKYNPAGSRKIGQCVEPGVQIVVTREISSDAILAAKSASTLKNESTKIDDDVASNETIVSEEIKVEKLKRSQVSKGYDGYADMEEF